MNKRANYAIIGLFVFLIGILLGYMTAFGTGATTTSRVVSAGTGGLCFDSDGGYNIYTYGYVTYNSKTYKDSCFSESKLYERGCVNDKHYTKRYECQYGCSGGACICIDSDSDGYTASWCGGKDCDDSTPLISPGLKETCSDGLDNDCDGLIDNDDPDCKNNPPAVNSTGNATGNATGYVGYGDIDEYNPPAVNSTGNATGNATG